MTRLQELGKQFREFRECSDMTVYDVALESNLEVVLIVLFEDGVEMPDPYELERICESVGITSGVLYES